MASYISSSSSSLLLPPPPLPNYSSTTTTQKPYFSFQTSSQFIPLKPLSLLPLQRESVLLFSSDTKLRRRRRSNYHRQPRLATVVAAQSNIVRVLQTVWKVGKDGIDAGTNLVPDSVPRPVARISVTGAAVVISLFVFKSFLSTVSFILAMMGLIYFVFIALNKNEGPRGDDGGSTSISEEDSLEEARRIMDKYK